MHGTHIDTLGVHFALAFYRLFVAIVQLTVSDYVSPLHPLAVDSRIATENPWLGCDPDRSARR